MSKQKRPAKGPLRLNVKFTVRFVATLDLAIMLAAFALF